MTTWSPQQEAALRAVSEWLAAPRGRPVFRLFGYAGTGKTTLARQIAMDFKGTTMFGAYTGKAAHVLKSKGCPGAATIHSLIYAPSDKSREQLRKLQEMRRKADDAKDARSVRSLDRMIAEEEKRLAQPGFRIRDESAVSHAQLLILDECSMIGRRMGEDLLSFEVPILVLGDPAQLPPVGDGGFFTNQQPDVMLTEVHRQEADSPIIRLATIVREGGRLQLGDYGDSRVVTSSTTRENPQLLLRAGQVIVGRNTTRRSANVRARSLLGRKLELPETGDKVICLRNSADIGILNGELFEAQRDADVVNSWHCELALLNGPTVVAHKAPFLGGEVSKEKKERFSAEEFDYGYAITCHKAQGSQWDDVLIVDEGHVFNEPARWLYTAITRAAKTVTVVKVA